MTTITMETWLVVGGSLEHGVDTGYRVGGHYLEMNHLGERRAWTQCCTTTTTTTTHTITHDVINHVVPSKKGTRSSEQLFRAC